MKVTIERPGLLSENELTLWRRLQRSHVELSRPFMCPEFVLAAAAARGDVWVAAFEEAEQLIGFFPFQRLGERESLPPAHGISSAEGAIADPRVHWDARELIRHCGLESWSFDHLVPTVALEPHYTRLRNTCFIDIRRGFEHYARERREAGSKQLGELERKARKLEREVGSVEFTMHSDDPELLRTLMRWKSEQFARTKFVDRFRIPWVVDVVERVHATQTAEFAGVLSVLRVDDEPVALNMGLRSHSALEIWFPTYAPRFARYSPGLILLLRLAQTAQDAGVATIELGRSGASYKQRLMNGERPQAVGCVTLQPRRERHHTVERLLRSLPTDRVGRVLDRREERRRWRDLEPKRAVEAGTCRCRGRARTAHAAQR
jgi:CelD/BcsL family acetyltransferase involved in cellulose biosynthesis